MLSLQLGCFTASVIIIPNPLFFFFFLVMHSLFALYRCTLDLKGNVWNLRFEISGHRCSTDAVRKAAVWKGAASSIVHLLAQFLRNCQVSEEFIPATLCLILESWRHRLIWSGVPLQLGVQRNCVLISLTTRSWYSPGATFPLSEKCFARCWFEVWQSPQLPDEVSNTSIDLCFIHSSVWV